MVSPTSTSRPVLHAMGEDPRSARPQPLTKQGPSEIAAVGSPRRGLSRDRGRHHDHRHVTPSADGLRDHRRIAGPSHLSFAENCNFRADTNPSGRLAQSVDAVVVNETLPRDRVDVRDVLHARRLGVGLHRLRKVGPNRDLCTEGALMRVPGSLFGVVRPEGPPEQGSCLGAKSQNHATRNRHTQHGNN